MSKGCFPCHFFISFKNQPTNCPTNCIFTYKYQNGGTAVVEHMIQKTQVSLHWVFFCLFVFCCFVLFCFVFVLPFSIWYLVCKQKECLHIIPTQEDGKKESTLLMPFCNHTCMERSFVSLDFVAFLARQTISCCMWCLFSMNLYYVRIWDFTYPWLLLSQNKNSWMDDTETQVS